MLAAPELTATYGDSIQLHYAALMLILLKMFFLQLLLSCENLISSNLFLFLLDI